MGAINPDLPTVTVKLWRADAVVLFDSLMTTDLNTVPDHTSGRPWSRNSRVSCLRRGAGATAATPCRL
jgi:hypothetical protein